MRRSWVVAAAAPASAFLLSPASAFLLSPVQQLQQQGVRMGRLKTPLHGAHSAAGARRERGALTTAMGAGDMAWNAAPAVRPADLLPKHTIHRARAPDSVDVGRKGLGETVKVWVLGVIFSLVSGLTVPSGATAAAAVASGNSVMTRTAGDTNKPKTMAGKKLVLVGAGISSTLHQVFDTLDTGKTGSISKASLYSSLVELKRRGFLTHELSDAELDKWLQRLVEDKSAGLRAAAAAGDTQAAGALESLARNGPQIRFETFKKAVEFTEKGAPVHRNAWVKKTRGDIMRTEVHEYGAQWRDKLKAAPTNILAAFKNQILYILEATFLGSIIIFIPTYYILPWNLFRFSDGQYNFAKKEFLKRKRIAGKRSEFFR
jgi:hypothetical protein